MLLFALIQPCQQQHGEVLIDEGFCKKSGPATRCFLEDSISKTHFHLLK
jgi:ribosomal protein RSM22 (predicted rRNA methylase)